MAAPVDKQKVDLLRKFGPTERDVGVCSSMAAPVDKQKVDLLRKFGPTERDVGVCSSMAAPVDKQKVDLLRKFGPTERDVGVCSSMAAPVDKQKADILRKFGLTERDVGVKCSDDHLVDITVFVSWKEVGARLPGVGREGVKDVGDNGGNLGDKRSNLVDMWKDRRGDDATYDEMITAMLKARKKNEAEKVCKLLRLEPTTATVSLPRAGGPKGPRGTTLADSPGLAVLFSCDYRATHGKFTPLLGTKEDAREMMATFDYLNYIVLDMHNPTGAEMRAKLQEVSDYLEQYRGPVEEKVIIFAFSGHGYSKGKIEKIFANDGDELEVVAEIVRSFTAHKFIFDIPKLFFIDACRGREWVVTDLDDELKEDKEEEAKSHEEPVGKGVAYAVANYRIEYATIPHHESYMDSDTKGSVWTPKLARALRERNEAFEVISSRIKAEVFAQFGKKKQVGQSVGQLVVGPLYLQKQ